MIPNDPNAMRARMPAYPNTFVRMGNNHGMGVPRPMNPIAMVNQNQVQQMQNWNGTREERMQNMSQNGQEPHSSSNSRTVVAKWQEDERLGDKATISPVLYANLKHPNLRAEYPDWNQRQKQIQRLWRRISSGFEIGSHHLN